MKGTKFWLSRRRGLRDTALATEQPHLIIDPDWTFDQFVDVLVKLKGLSGFFDWLRLDGFWTVERIRSSLVLLDKDTSGKNLITVDIDNPTGCDLMSARFPGNPQTKWSDKTLCLGV